MEKNVTIEQKFREYLQQIGYSKGSQYQIPSCIKEFEEETQKPFETITQSDILTFYKYLQTRPLRRRTGALSEAMINHYVFSLKTFFAWMEQTEQIKVNPISSIKFRRPQVNTREPLSQKEVQHLFQIAETPKETAVLHLFYSCGLRRTEAENLNLNDIHFHKNILYVRAGKGAKRRAIPMNEQVKKELEAYRQSLSPSFGGVGEVAYMLNKRGERMRGSSYNRILKRIIERASFIHFPTAISLHHLRHSIATHLLENGLSIEFVRDFLGHSHLEATQIYAKVNLGNYEL